MHVWQINWKTNFEIKDYENSKCWNVIQEGDIGKCVIIVENIKLRYVKAENVVSNFEQKNLKVKSKTETMQIKVLSKLEYNYKLLKFARLYKVSNTLKWLHLKNSTIKLHWEKNRTIIAHSYVTYQSMNLWISNFYLVAWDRAINFVVWIHKFTVLTY